MTTIGVSECFSGTGLHMLCQSSESHKMVVVVVVLKIQATKLAHTLKIG